MSGAVPLLPIRLHGPYRHSLTF